MKWLMPMERVAYVISDGEWPGVHLLLTVRDKAGWHYYRLGPDPKRELLSAGLPYPTDMEPAEVVRILAEAEGEKGNPGKA